MARYAWVDAQITMEHETRTMGATIWLDKSKACLLGQHDGTVEGRRGLLPGAFFRAQRRAFV